jgi:rhodanese-related sulfurtransferase
MTFLLENWSLILIAVVSAGMLMWPVVARSRGGSLTAADAVQLMNREKAVVVDISEPAEFAAGHIVGARNVPLAAFEQRLPEVVKNKALPVIVVDTNGSRSPKAAGIAKNLGYAQAQAMAGGLAGWKEANLPLEKS